MFKRVAKWAAVAATAVSLSGAPAVAQTVAAASSSSSAAYYFSGMVGAEYLRDSTFALGFGLANLSFGLAPVAYGSMPGVGFDFGLYGYLSDDPFISQDALLFAAVTFALAGGRFSIGAPRNATDGVNDTPVPGGSLYFRHFGGTQFLVAPWAYAVAMGWNRNFLGMRFDRTIGALAMAVSVMQLTYLTTTITNVALGLSHDDGTRRLFGTVDYYRDNTGSFLQAAMGASYRFGGGSSSSLWPIVVGGMLGYTASGGGNSDTLLSIYARMHPIDRLAVTASIAHYIPNFGAAQTIYGLSLLYAINTGLAMQFGVAAGRGSSPLWTLGIRSNFDR